jgi:hypothetical protein
MVMTSNAAVHLRRTERPKGARPDVRCNGLFGVAMAIRNALPRRNAGPGHHDDRHGGPE